MLTTVVSHIIRLSLLLAIVFSAAQAQQPQNPPQPPPSPLPAPNIPELISELKSEELVGATVERLVRAHAVEAIPALKEQFQRREDISDRAKIASALVRLGERDETYWQYLVKEATEVLNNDPPDLFQYDGNGKAIKPGNDTPPEVQTWAAAHNLSKEAAWEYLFSKGPGQVLDLAATGDPRGVPVLRRALLARNVLVQSSAAMGLAQAKDKDSVHDIVEACRRAPSEVAQVLARWLVYFDDPEAQSAFDRYVPAEMAKAMREERAAGRPPIP